MCSCRVGLLVELESNREYPALREHPLGALFPLEFVGNQTAEQEQAYNGLFVEAAMETNYPVLHEHPPGAWPPLELAVHQPADLTWAPRQSNSL